MRAAPPTLTPNPQALPPAMHRKFKDLLHKYKRDDFQLVHHQKDVGQIARECMDVSQEVLHKKFEYHFHKLPDANRAEIINMINNYTREAILPPIVEGLVERQVMLEHRLSEMQKLIEAMLETLSEEPSGTPAG